jgi:uncharacterized membrane protein
MLFWRLALGLAGLALGLFGVYRLLTQVPMADVTVLGIWLVAAVAIHEGVLSPAVVTTGWILGRLVPPRARRYVQGALIAGGLVTVVAVPMIYRQGAEPASKALLRQNFAGNLTLLLALVAAGSLAFYAVHVARDRQRMASGAAADAAQPPDE